MTAAPTPLSPLSFLARFPGYRIQYFDDTPAKDTSKAAWAETLEPGEAARRQLRGCGVYFSPNGFSGPRMLEHLSAIQALFVDIDCAKEGDGMTGSERELTKRKTLKALLSFDLPPHVVIGTKNGLQAIWRVRPLPPAEGLPLFEEAERLLIAFFAADPSAKDATRVLRVPGFDHLKNPNEPYRCPLLLADFGREPYGLEAVVEALRTLGPATQGEVAAATTAGSVMEGVPEGGRNTAAASVAGRLLRKLPLDAWDEEGWRELAAWNEKNRPPLPERELRQVFASVGRRERERRQREPTKKKVSPENRALADRLIDLVTPEECLLFRDQIGTAFASIVVGSHRETWPVRSRRFRMWLSSRLWGAESRAPGANALAAALTLLEARAAFEGVRRTLSNRVAFHEGALWYDLASEGWEAVLVTEEGWRVVSDPPPLFYRYAHQLPQALPVAGGDVREVLPFVNLSRDVPEVLILTYLVSCFFPDIQHPVPVLHGPQGAAKTTTSWVLRHLIDPSVLQSLALPPAIPDLVQHLSHHWFAMFDNVSDLPEWASDVLCRAVTGEGFSKRELYSDDEDVIYAFRRCIGLNGINMVARKPDLLDRCLLLRLDRIPSSGRKTFRSVWEAFEAARPRVLGSIFDTLSSALRSGLNRNLDTPPRMADFAERGCIIADVLGLGADAFLSAYARNIEEQNMEALQANAVGTAVLAFLEGRGSWEGSPSALLSALEGIAARERINVKGRSWPGSASALTRRLNEIRATLSEVGISVHLLKRYEGRRVVRLERVSADTNAPDVSRGDRGGMGGIPQTFSPPPGKI